MSNYSLYCTEAQTKKAHELGAPLNTWGFARELVIPTAEQMVNWLEEQGFSFYILKDYLWREEVQYGYNWYHNKGNLVSRKEATLAAIDAALEYLSNNK